AEDGIRDFHVTGVQTCALPILFCESDGTFPNHHPDPTVVENLEDLIAAVREDGAELGIAFDGDADRIGVVDSEGDVIWGDHLLKIGRASGRERVMMSVRGVCNK